MTNLSNVYNLEVETPGDLLVFDIPGKDYYKISLVQEIEETETEVVSQYNTLDGSQCKFINIKSKFTLAGIQSILDSHRELDLLNVGDTVIIKVSGVDATFIIAEINAYNTHDVIFVSKYLVNTGMTNSGVYSSDNHAHYLDNVYYQAIDPAERVFLKQKLVSVYPGYNITPNPNTSYHYVWAPAAREVWFNSGSDPTSNKQFSLFTNASNRIKSLESSNPIQWQTASGTMYSGQAHHHVSVSPAGEVGGSTWYSNAVTYTLPCFCLSANI